MKNMEHFKKLNGFIKDSREIISLEMTSLNQTFLDSMETMFGQQLEQYMISLFELDEFINVNKNSLNDETIEKINHLIESLNNCREDAKKILIDMENIFNSDPKDFYKKQMKQKIQEVIKNSSGYVRKILNTFIKEEVINMASILSLYYKEQQNNIKKYYNLFEFQDEIISNYERILSKKERLENIDIKRFTCTYDQMKEFLESKGYVKVRQNGTSHAIYKNKNGHSLPLPNKRGDMCIITVSLILNQCNSNRNELGKFIRNVS